jgi:type VI secretion system protein ImpM
MIAARPAPSGSFAVGWYGKIPGTGDFIVRRVPASFSESWDRWLQQSMDGSRERLGRRWRDAFLTMPAWRFVLSPGLVTPNAWAGVMLPSVDAVGRYFPLTAACPLPSASLDLVATLFAAAPWFDEIEAIALSAIAPKVDTAAIDAALVRREFRSEWLHLPADDAEATVAEPRSGEQLLALLLGERTDGERPSAGLAALAARLAEPCAAWLAEPSELFGRTLLLCEGLPAAEQYSAMMDGRWAEHGWGHRDLRGGAE